ncbi:unnamed protein product [Arctia plantaginis]|uniref:Uncharacterized protein n=1 Tax=Arctia plantaginis TaxID=874455 RepID=A0A8S0ZN50_ARCPL|nr:unnamed protein product [Arctia plantaginis]
MNFFENITLRRRRRSISGTESYNECSSRNTTIEGATISAPNISVDEDDEIDDLKRQISELQSQLQAAHEEINNLSIENTDLKNTLEEINKKHSLVKKATKILSTEICTPIKKRNSRRSTPCKKSKPHTSTQCYKEDNSALETSIPRIPLVNTENQDKNLAQRQSTMRMAYKNETQSKKNALLAETMADGAVKFLRGDHVPEKAAWVNPKQGGLTTM